MISSEGILKFACQLIVQIFFRISRNSSRLSLNYVSAVVQDRWVPLFYVLHKTAEFGVPERGQKSEAPNRRTMARHGSTRHGGEMRPLANNSSLNLLNEMQATRVFRAKKQWTSMRRPCVAAIGDGHRPGNSADCFAEAIERS